MSDPSSHFGKLDIHVYWMGASICLRSYRYVAARDN